MHARHVVYLAMATVAFRAVQRGGFALDVGVGRRTRALGPVRVHMEAPPETVFDVIARPYLKRTPRAMGKKLEVLERGSDMVLAAHYTPVAPGLTVGTVETVRFERPTRIHFRLVRGPVASVTETFELTERDGGTDFEYSGEMQNDFGPVAAAWLEVVGRSWEQAVERSLPAVKEEAERRAGRRRR